jgi:hypothetical protein
MAGCANAHRVRHFFAVGRYKQSITNHFATVGTHQANVVIVQALMWQNHAKYGVPLPVSPQYFTSRSLPPD